MDNQSPQNTMIALVILGGLYFLFGFLVNFKYVAAGAIAYPAFREIDKIYREYEWMLAATNQEKFIFWASTVGVGILALLVIDYLFIKPMAPWYRASVYKVRERKVWNPVVLCSIWIVEAVIIHYLVYSPLLKDKEIRFYSQDYYLVYYMYGIGAFLIISSIFHLKIWVQTSIKLSSLPFGGKNYAFKRSKKKAIRTFSGEKDNTVVPNNQLIKSHQIDPTLKENFQPDPERTVIESTDGRFNSLLDIRDGKFHYQKIKELNRGGFGVVYLVKNVKSDTLYAAKCPHISFESDSSSERIRYQREIEAHSSIIHKNVVRLVHTCHQESLVYIIMEYVDGEDLKKVIRNNKVPDLPTTIDLMCQILDGLSVIHSNQVIHRDIKPSNILVNSKGIPKITDFGIAKLDDATQITLTGAFMGTPEYMSPEQYRGEKLDIRTDIYSIGLTFYEMLSNRQSPTVGLDRNELYKYKINNSYPPLHQINKRIPKALSIVIHQAFHPVVSMRYSSAKDFKEAILGS